MRRNMITATSFAVGVFVWAICQEAALADIYMLPADISLGVHTDNNNSFCQQPCTITSGGTDYDTDYMLLYFDFAGWHTDTEVVGVKLRLTRSSDEQPDKYTITAKGFYPGNTQWYKEPANATGNYQYYDVAGDGDISWENSAGNVGTVETAGSYYFASGSNTWDGDTLEFSLDATKVKKWITGETLNNGLRLYSNKSTSPFFYGGGAVNLADRPTLIIEANAPEPCSLVILCTGTIGLLCRRRPFV